MRHDNGFYNSPEWKAFRREYLKAHPVCGVPGCGRRAVHLDHVRARAKGGASFDPSNIRGCCWSHHSLKTVQYDGGFGRAPTTKGADVNGKPLDPSHPWHKGNTHG